MTPQDEGTEGRPYLYAYGRKWLAELAGVSEKTVWRAIRDGEFDIGDPVAVVCWALEKRKRADVAADIRDALK